MELGDAERLLAQRMLARRERRAGSWRRMRWLCLALSGMQMGLGAYALWLTHCPLADCSLADLLHSGPPAVQTLALDRDAMAGYLEFRFRRSVMLSTFQALAVLQIGLGICLLADTVAGWNRHLTDALLTKVLRTELSRQEANEPSP
ncbi:MAG: hypothetical protein FJ290_31230 [Planctomycetes bacterium]|nr:hypothetical protein [Planctomycetota bacterium]